MEARSIAVLTQFNLEPPAHWGVQRRCLDTDWLENRIELLQRTSLPSLQGQTQKGFCWIIFIHPESPGWLRQILSNNPSDGIARHLVEVSGFDGIDYGSLVKAIISTKEWLTVKLDSDDLLARDFLEKANSYNKIGTYCFEDGAYLDVKTMRAYRRHYPSNPFPFRISTESHSALDEGHHKIRIDFRVRTSDPMWMQFHHGDNVSPDWNPLFSLGSKYVREKFSFPESEMVKGPPQRRIEALTQFLLRLGNCMVKIIEHQIRRIIRKIKSLLGVVRR